MSEYYFDPFEDIEVYPDRQAEEAAHLDTIQKWVEAGVYTQEQGEQLFIEWLDRR